MKRMLSIVAALLMVSAVCFAQENPAGQAKKNFRERAMAEKIGFLTQKLQLSPEEAQAFWPVYNQYAEAAKVARNAVKEARKALRQPKEGPAVSDKEMEKRIETYLKACEDEKSVLGKYNKSFLKVLSASKVAKLYIAEAQFGNNMLKSIAGKGHKNEGPHRPDARNHNGADNCNKDCKDCK